LFFRIVPPAHTLVQRVNEYAFASIVQARPVPVFGRPVHPGSRLDYGPMLLLMPFGFHLAVNTLPSDGSSPPASETLLPLLDMVPLI
jgi:hypothetical protein